MSSNASEIKVDVSIVSHDKSSLMGYLVAAGFPEDDATEFATIVEQETPTSKEEPFGQNAKNWIALNLKKAAIGTWKMGISVATSVLTEAALKYYGIK